MVAGNARQGGDVQHAGGSSAGLGSPEAAASGPAAAAAAAKRRRDRLSAEKKNKRTRAIALNATLQERRDEPEEDTEPDPEDREVPENVSDDEEDDTFPRVALPPLKNSLGKWNELFIVRSAPEMARSVTPHEGAAGEAVVTPTPIRRYNTRQNTQGGRSAAVEPGDMKATLGCERGGKTRTHRVMMNPTGPPTTMTRSIRGSVAPRPRSTIDR